MHLEKLKKMTEEDLTKEGADIIDRAVIRMLFSSSDAVFFAHFLIQMQVHYDLELPKSLGMGMSLTNGRFNLYVDKKRLKENGLDNVDTCAWILQHEAMHWVLAHHFREREYFAQDEDKIRTYHELCNIAQDAEIHELISVHPAVADKAVVVGKKGTPFEHLPPKATWEEYFEILRKDARVIRVGSGAGSGESGKDDRQENQEGRYEYDINGNHVRVRDTLTGKSWEFETTDHGAPEQDAQEDLNKEILRQTTAEALKNARPSMGTEPGGLCSVIEKLIAPPRIPWNNKFRQLVGKFARFNWQGSWRRFSRRLGEGFRGRVKDHGLFVVVVPDTSGSVGDDYLREFDNEIRAIRKLRKIRRLHVIECDAAVQAAYDLPEGGKISYRGRGGTDFRPPFEYLKAQKMKPDMLVYLTDSQGTFPEMKPDYPVIWCVTTQGDLGHIPWGDVVVMNIDKPR